MHINVVFPAQLQMVNTMLDKMNFLCISETMKRVIKQITIKFILIILALQILNMSISCRIADDSFYSQLDASVNIADHAVEFIVEEMLGYKNAFPELKENQQQHSLTCSHKVQEFSFYAFSPKLITNNFAALPAKNYTSLIVQAYNKFFQKITPPPKAC